MPEKDKVLMLLEERQAQLLDQWVEHLRADRKFRQELLGPKELRRHCERFFELMREGLAEGERDVSSEAWAPMRRYLASVLRDWVELGYSAAEVTAFVLLVQRPLIDAMAELVDASPTDVLSHVRELTELLNQLALHTSQIYQTQLQSVIQRQQEDLLELSTPVVELWEGVLALPLIGTLDTSRTQVVMESILEKIVETRADVAIIDITGVPTVDTMVAQHLLKAVAASRLMGAQCIISGVRPSIAQTMVQLGIELREVVTKPTLADAFSLALEIRRLRVTDCPDNGRS